MAKIHKLKIPKLTRKPKPVTDKRWLFTRSMVAEVLSVSIDTVKNYERRKLLKPLRPGGPGSLVLFDRDQVLHFAGLSDQ